MWASVEPLVRWLGMRVGGLLSPEMRAQLNYQVGIAGDYLGLLASEVEKLHVFDPESELSLTAQR